MQRGLLKHRARLIDRAKKMAEIGQVLLPPEAEAAYHCTIYTDGSAGVVGRPGGWAVVLVQEGQTYATLAGPMAYSSSNRAELTAILMAVRVGVRMAVAQEVPIKIWIRSDSSYCVEGCNDWLWKWLSDKWQGHNNQTPENVDLWMQLSDLLMENKGVFCIDWVKGHGGNPFNELADQLARRERLLEQGEESEGETLKRLAKQAANRRKRGKGWNKR